MASKNGKKPHAEKTTGESTGRAQPCVPVGALIPQPHGGALRNGGTNAGGSGAPPSVLREALRGTLASRLTVIQQIADGECVKNAEIPLTAVLAHAKCPKCEGKLQPTGDPADIALITLRGKESATPGDRLKAIGLAAQYGLGPKDDATLASPEVQFRLVNQARLIASRDSWNSKELLDALTAEVWK